MPKTVKKAVKKTTTKKTSKSKIKEITMIKHDLVPKHEKLTEKEKNALFEEYNISLKELPKIFLSDPAIRHLDPQENDVIKITRPSSTSGVTVFYRGVINE